MSDGEATGANWPVTICALAVVTLSAVLHLALFSRDSDFRYPDSDLYFTTAGQMISGNGFADGPGVPDTIRTPGYPIFLALCRLLGLDDRGIVLIQHAGCVGLSLAIFLVGLFLTRSRLAATTAGLIYAIDPTTLRYGNLLLTETLFTILLFLIVFLTTQPSNGPRRVIVIGLLSGLLSLIRPAAILYPAVLLLGLMLKVRAGRARVALIFILSAAAIPMAWTIRNGARTGVFVFCSISGTNLLMHRAAGALAIEDGGDFDSNLTRHQNVLLAKAQERLQSQYGVNAAELPHAIQGREYAREARPVIFGHLAAYAGLTLRGLRKNLLDDDSETVTMLNDSSIDDAYLVMATRLYTAAVIGLALAGALLLWRRDRGLAILLAGTILYFVFIAAGAEAESRFRSPVVPQIALLSGVAVATLTGSARRRFGRR